MTGVAGTLVNCPIDRHCQGQGWNATCNITLQQLLSLNLAQAHRAMTSPTDTRKRLAEAGSRKEEEERAKATARNQRITHRTGQLSGGGRGAARGGSGLQGCYCGSGTYLLGIQTLQTPQPISQVAGIKSSTPRSQRTWKYLPHFICMA